MFERFTDSARRVIIVASDESRRLRSGYIGTDHLFLGVIADREGVAGSVLSALGVPLDRLRHELIQAIGKGQPVQPEHVPFSRGAKKAVALALTEAGLLRHDWIEAEHVLLGLLCEGEGIGAQLLADAGASLEQARKQVLQCRNEPTQPPAAGTR